MKNKLQERSALFFHCVFLIFCSCAATATVSVCRLTALCDPGLSFFKTIGFALLFAVVSACYLRFFCSRYGVAGCLAVCFIIRFIFVSCVQVEPFSDFRLYHTMAEAMAKGEPLFSQYGSVFPHTIGFSWLLSLVYRLFGANVFIVQLIHVFLETLTAYLLYLCTIHLFDKTIGILATFIYTISPAFLLYSELLATEIIFTLLVFVLLYLAIRYAEQNKLRHALLFGALSALSNGIRPMGLVLMLAFGICTVCFLKHKRRLIALGLALICYFGVWFGVGYGLSSINGQEIAKAPLGYNLYIGSNYHTLGKWNPEDYRYANELIYQKNLSASEFHKQLQQEGIARYRDNGIRKNTELFVQKFAVLWGSEMLPCDYLNRSKLFSELDGMLHFKNISNGFHLFLMVSVLLGAVFWNKKSKHMGVFFILLFVFGVTCQHLIAEVQERYSYTALALLMPIAAYGVKRCYKKGAKLFVQATSGRYQSGDGKRPRC